MRSNRRNSLEKLLCLVTFRKESLRNVGKDGRIFADVWTIRCRSLGVAGLPRVPCRSEHSLHKWSEPLVLLAFYELVDMKLAPRVY
jgi:hypothetical protein